MGVEVNKQFLGVFCKHERSCRHRNNTILAGRPGPITAGASDPVSRREFACEAKIGERVELRSRPQDNVTPSAAVSPVRPASRDKLFPAKT